MTTLSDAQEIVSLFDQLEKVNARLKEIEDNRERGRSIDVSFTIEKAEGYGGYEAAGLRYRVPFRKGELNDIAAIVLARLSDQVAAQKRQIERKLVALGARL